MIFIANGVDRLVRLEVHDNRLGAGELGLRPRRGRLEAYPDQKVPQGFPRSYGVGAVRDAPLNYAPISKGFAQRLPSNQADLRRQWITAACPDFQ
jgi:hypothetical protein